MMWVILLIAIYTAIQSIFLNVQLLTGASETISEGVAFKSIAWDFLTALSWALYIQYA